MQPLERGGHHQKEVAGEHSVGMKVKECGPGLCRPATTPARSQRHVPKHRARGDRQTEIRAATPRAISGCDFGDEPPELNENPGPTTRT
jgi:hypothetical protein